MTDNPTGKNWMSETLSLQNILSGARQLRRISSTSQFEKTFNNEHASIYRADAF